MLTGKIMAYLAANPNWGKVKKYTATENADPAQKLAAGIKTSDPWWVLLLKVIAYAIGLILGGAITTSCANMIGII